MNTHGGFKCLCSVGVTGMLCDLGIVYPRYKRTVNPWKDEVNRAKSARPKFLPHPDALETTLESSTILVVLLNP